MAHDIEHNGHRFRVQVERDDCSDAPWERDCGHPPVVSEWKRSEEHKRPSDRVVGRDGGYVRFYDWREAVIIAREEGWGLESDRKEKLAARFGKPVDRLTEGEIASEAVRLDFERMRAWCSDEWHYVGVIVTLLHDDGVSTGYADSLWGIESDAEDYLECLARELADGILTNKTADDAASRQADASAARVKELMELGL